MDNIVLTGADQQIADKPGTSQPDVQRYHGYSIRETGGAARATIEIFDGLDATGVLLDTVSLAAGESSREYYVEGIQLRNGLFVDIVSGAVRGSVRVG